MTGPVSFEFAILSIIRNMSLALQPLELVALCPRLEFLSIVLEAVSFFCFY